MQWPILESKNIITNPKDGQQIVDLISSSMDYTDSSPVIIDAFYVADDAVMRPDLISYLAYGNTDNFDLILKFNAISNPFSLDTTNYILVPDPKYMEEAITTTDDTNIADQIRAQYIDPSKGNVTDPQRLEFEQAVQNLRKSVQGANFATLPLPPNLAQPGSSEGTVNTSNGTVTLGG